MSKVKSKVKSKAKSKAKKNEVVTVEVVEEKSLQTVTPMSLIQRAQDANASIEQMQQLLDLQLRYEDNEAKKAFHKAVAAFKAEAINIVKNKKVSYNTSKGKTEYSHAELGSILNTVTPLMSKHGLSHHWETEQDGSKIKVTCFLTHELGFSKQTSLESAKDDSGGKNSIQAIGSAKTYLERYTFLAIVGLAARDQDDDGDKADTGDKADPVTYISESQVMDIESMVGEVDANETQMLEYLSIKAGRMIEDISQIPDNMFGFTVNILEKKRS